MEEVRLLRRWMARVSLGLVAVFALVAGVCFGLKPAQGVLLGGLASALGFALAARSIRLDSSSLRRVRLSASLGVVGRMGLYGAVLYKAYTLDPVHLHGFIGALAGLSVTRLAATVAGLTGWDQKKAGQ